MIGYNSGTIKVTEWSTGGGDAPGPDVDFLLVSLSNYEVARTVSGTVEQITDKDAIVNRTTGTTVYRDQQMQLLYVGAPDAPIVWTSSNEEVATVDSDGFVTHLTTGTTTITATAGAQSLQKTLNLTVSTPSISDELVDYVAGSLAKSASDAIDDLLEGKSVSTALKLFTTQDHSEVTRTNKAYSSNPSGDLPWQAGGRVTRSYGTDARFGGYMVSIPTTENATHYCFLGTQGATCSWTAGVRHVWSFFAKRVGSHPDNYGRIHLEGSVAAGIGWGPSNMWWDVTDGTCAAGCSIEPAGDGWYRCWMSWTPTVTVSNATAVVRAIYHRGYVYSFAGTGSDGVQLTGFQIEESPSGVPTLLIPTTTSASTVTAPYYVRNGNFWGASLGSALCAISPWNSTGGPTRAGVAISDLHIIFAAHYPIGKGATVRFVLADNTVVTRTLVSRLTHPEYTGSSTGYAHDLTVGLLDSPLPAGVVPAKVLPDDYQDYLPGLSPQRSLPALCLDQEEKGLVTDLVGLSSMATFSYPNRVNWEKRAEFYESKIGGDSGNPAFLIVDGELVLLTVWTFGGAGSGTSIVHDKNAINLMMSQLGGGRQLAEIDLTGFTDFS